MSRPHNTDQQELPLRNPRLATPSWAPGSWWDSWLPLCGGLQRSEVRAQRAEEMWPGPVSGGLDLRKAEISRGESRKQGSDTGRTRPPGSSGSAHIRGAGVQLPPGSLFGKFTSVAGSSCESFGLKWSRPCSWAAKWPEGVRVGVRSLGSGPGQMSELLSGGLSVSPAGARHRFRDFSSGFGVFGSAPGQ